MKNSFDIIRHTKKLLAYGIFHHLTDDTISILHHLLLKGECPTLTKKKLFEFWQQGDFSDNSLHMQLLHETNFILTQNGENSIQENFIEIYAY